jgi:hypothetical protein
MRISLGYDLNALSLSGIRVRLHFATHANFRDMSLCGVMQETKLLVRDGHLHFVVPIGAQGFITDRPRRCTHVLYVEHTVSRYSMVCPGEPRREKTESSKEVQHAKEFF